MSKKQSKLSFEDSITRINAIITDLEEGGSSLEETLKMFEEGMKLTEQCREQIADAEIKVNTLIRKSDGFEENSKL